MGFFRRLFSAKKDGANSSSSSKEKRRWSFSSRSSKQTTPSQSQSLSQPQPQPQSQSQSHPNKRDASYESNLDANKRAIAVAAATTAVAEAALAAAHAAAEVVRLTSTGGRSGVGGGVVAAPASAHVSQQRWKQELAAVKIQSAFRGYLARRALKALKALVKLQALVRGHIVRKQTADMLKRMQTLVKVQARARANRTHMSESLRSSSKSSLSRSTVPGSPDKSEYQFRARSTKFDGPSILKRCGSNSNFRDVTDLEKARLGSNWLDRWMEENIWNNHRVNQHKGGHAADDVKSDKILEVDTWKPHLNSQQHSRAFQSSLHGSALDHKNHSYMTFNSPSKFTAKNMNPIPSESSGEVLSSSSRNFPVGKGEAALRTADNSPQVTSASYRPGSSARIGPFTPTRSEYSWGYISGYSGYPNYMANTESSRAKVRSQSAPRQRLEFKRYNSIRRSTQGLWDRSINSEREDFTQHVDFRNSTSPASHQLNKLGSTNFR